MKRLSLALLVLLFLALSISHSNAQSDSQKRKPKKCRTEWYRAVPCYPQILDFSLGGWFWNRKIDPKCCKIIIELGDQCNHRHLGNPIFAAAHKHCTGKKSPPPPPGKRNRFCKLRIAPFVIEIRLFSRNKISKPSEACCAAVLGAQKDCGSSQSWDGAFLKCADYCKKNHP